MATALITSSSVGLAQETLTRFNSTTIRELKSQKSKSKAHLKAIEATITPLTAYQTGATSELILRLYLSNTDFEYGDSLSITFPAGIKPNTSINDPLFVSTDPDATPEALNGVVGQTISWGDNDDSYGGIESETSITFSVNITTDPGVTGDQTVIFHVSGDKYGPNPQDFDGSFIISTTSPPADLDVTIFPLYPYYSTPIKHAPPNEAAALIYNSGGELKDNVNFYFNIVPGTFSETHPIQNPLKSDSAQLLFTNNQFTPTATGNYYYIGSAPYLNDANSLDNGDTLIFNISSNYFCYNNYDTASSTGLGIGAAGYIGAVFNLEVNDTINKVEAYFKNPALGAVVNCSIYNYDILTGTVGSLVNKSAEYTFTSTTGRLHTFKFINVPLPAGAYLIAIDEVADGFNMGLGSTFDNFQGGTHYVKIGTDDPEDLAAFPPQFQKTFLFRPYFGTVNYTGINQAKLINVDVNPNPASDQVIITGIESGTAVIMDNLGREIMNLAISSPSTLLNVSQLPTGNYLLRLSNNDGVLVKKLVIRK